MKKCSTCGSFLNEEDERCGVCGNVWSESEQKVEKLPVNRAFTRVVRVTRILFVTGVASLGFGIAAILESGFGSDLVFITGVALLPYGVFILANLALGGLGKGSRTKMQELRARRRGHLLFPADDEPEK